MSSGFSDHFSKNASGYSSYRPNYPGELFGYLASVAPSRKCAWDCATGSGQAAVPLAGYFDEVHATDASENQILKASPADNLIYSVSPAEACGLSGGSVDVVTVAQALHWFDIDAFGREVERVLCPGGNSCGVDV